MAVFQPGPDFLEWIPLVEAEDTTLSLAYPDGQVQTLTFEHGARAATALVDESGAPIPDGTYTWELRLQPRQSAELRDAIETARRNGDDHRLFALQRLAMPFTQSGHFTILEGLLLVDLEEAIDAEKGHRGSRSAITAPDQTVPDDLIVDGKGCIGLACVVNEAFSAEALRLKQSVVRLRFEDTSSAVGFPARDWQLTANDAASAGSGGVEKFSIEDLTAATTPFTLRGGAPNSSIYVDGTGKVGLGTATPAQRLHLAVGSLPTVRLEQTGGTVRTWELEGSHTGLAVRDVTGGNAVPVRVAAGAPTSSLEVAADGRVGLGTPTPANSIHVVSSNSPGLRLEQTGGSARTWELEGSGTGLRVRDVSGGSAVPLRVAAGAPTSSLEVGADGKVGMGTPTPSQQLHIAASTAPTVRLEQTGGTPRTWDVEGSSAALAVRDVSGSNSVPLRVAAGAPTSALEIAASGKVGLGTAAPAQSFHVAAASTPTLRLEQTGGTVRTWDVGASNTSFSVADVTGAATPLRIAAGATTGSLEIGANNKVGIGTDPATFSFPTLLTIKGSSPGDASIKVQNTASDGFGGLQFHDETGAVGFFFGIDNAQNTTRLNSISSFPFLLMTQSVERIRITPGGDVGIGTSTPSSKLHVNGGDIRVSGGSFIDDGVTLNVPDYVFEPGYPLLPIEELAAFVMRERHLPNVPSAAAIAESGLDIGDSQMRLLEKVEELTLYAIEQHNTVVRLSEQTDTAMKVLADQERVIREQGKLSAEQRRLIDEQRGLIESLQRRLEREHRR